MENATKTRHLTQSWSPPLANPKVKLDFLSGLPTHN